MAETQEHIPMITKVRVKHFRSIEDAEFTLEPLTVLVGPNASGKSNLLDLFAFLGDIATGGLEAAVNGRGGIDDIGWRSPTGRVVGPEFTIECKFAHCVLQYHLSLVRNTGNEYSVNEETAQVFVEDSKEPIRRVAFRYGKLVYPSVRRLLRRSIEQSAMAGHSNSPDGSTLEAHIRLLERENTKKLLLFSDFAILYIFYLGHLLELGGLVENGHGDVLVNVLLAFTEHAQGFQCYQIEPTLLHAPTLMENSRRLASDGSNLASALRALIRNNRLHAGELKSCLAAVMPGFQDLRVSSTGSHGVVRIKHERTAKGEKSTWFDLYHEADGTIRLLALLVALYQTPSLSLTCLEEPESAIHPGALAVVADVLKEAVLRGQVLVTTHSPDLIGQLPIESIRAVSSDSGSTKVGPVAEHQMQSVTEGLFSAGEIHQMEGLYPSPAGGQAEC